LIWERSSLGHSAYICIVVVKSTYTSIDDILETGGAKHDGTIALQSKALFTNTHWDLVRSCARRSVECRCDVAAVDVDNSGRAQKSDDEDRVGIVLPTIRPTLEIVAGGVVGRLQGGIRRIAVNSAWLRAVPIDQLISIYVSIR